MSKPSLKNALDANDSIADMREKRRQLALSFLKKNNAQENLSNALGNDASFRTYYRLDKPENSLLMDSPAAHEPVAPFVKIAEHLLSLGLTAPEIIAKDLENNFLIIEDFGDRTFSKLINAGHDREELYSLAVDVLAKLHNEQKASWVSVPEYTNDTFIEETGRTVNWYYPILKNKKPSSEMREKWVQAWRSVFDGLPEIEKTLVLRDYHCDNLMLVDHKQGIESCGLLDFQDGLIGPTPYDLVSILENDRIAVPQDIQDRMIERYCRARGQGFDRESFMLWYRVLGTQRQMKILGLFYRLYIRDLKPGYLNFIPQVITLIKQGLKAPVLAPVAQLFEEEFGEITAFDKDDLDIDELRLANLSDTLPL